MTRMLVTGGCGFIGSNFINYILTNPEVQQPVKVLNLDKITYAGNGENIKLLGLDNHTKYRFVRGDICDSNLVKDIFESFSPDIVFNFAAESHVDRSINDSMAFVRSNILGAATILEQSRNSGIERFVQISTDEVYGSIKQGSFPEESPLNPSSPYAASKASAEMIALAHFKTSKVPVIITRSANNYGPLQFPEKLLPLFITNLIDEKKVPLMWSDENPGLNIRDWLHVEDNCRAILYVAQHGQMGEVYNIPGENEKTNKEMTDLLLKIFRRDDNAIEKVPHRKGHDFRYSISGRKLADLGFQYKHKDLFSELEEIVDWYKQNQAWWRWLKNG